MRSGWMGGEIREGTGRDFLIKISRMNVQIQSFYNDPEFMG